MSHVKLGNGMPVEVTRDEAGGETRRAVTLPEGQDHAVTDVHIPDGVALGEALQAITGGGGVWDYHSDHDGPVWVASDDPTLASALAEHYKTEKRQWRQVAGQGQPPVARAAAADTTEG